MAFKKKLRRCFCAAVIILLQIFFSAKVFAASISVSVSLPAASNEDIDMFVSICEEFTEFCNFGSIEIAAGALTGVTLIENIDGGQKYVEVSCRDCAPPVVSSTYLSGLGQSTASFAERIQLTVTQDVNLVLPTFPLATGSVIRGVFSTPITQTADRSVTIDACGDIRSGCEFVNVVLPSGATSVPYEIAVPDHSDYEVEFSCSLCESPLFGRGFFAADAPNTTTTVRDNATLIDGSDDVNGVNLRLVQGNLISGTVFLPKPATSSAQFQVVARDISDDFQQDDVKSIPIGQSSASYSLLVAPENQWYLQVECFGCTGQGIFDEVFFSDAAPLTSTWNINSASEFSGAVTGQARNMTLPMGTSISGTVSMPDMSRPNGHSLSVFAYNANDNGWLSDNIFMSSDQQSTGFSIDVPAIFNAQDSLIVGVTPRLSSPSTLSNSYVPYAFHSNLSRVQTNRNKASPLATNAGALANINLGLETGNTISGSINTPDNEDANRNLDIYMIADQLNNRGADLAGVPVERFSTFVSYGGYGGTRGSGNYLYSPANAGLINYDPLRITANVGSSRFYTVRISSDTDTSWRTYYGCLTCGSDFQRYGFFKDLPGSAVNPEETVSVPSQASFVPGGSNYLHNLVLLQPDDSFCFAIKTASDAVVSLCL